MYIDSPTILETRWQGSHVKIAIGDSTRKTWWLLDSASKRNLASSRFSGPVSLFTDRGLLLVPGLLDGAESLGQNYRDVTDIDGVLGLPFLSLFVVEINYPEKRVVVYPSWIDHPGEILEIKTGEEKAIQVQHQIDSLITKEWSVETYRTKSMISSYFASIMSFVPNSPDQVFIFPHQGAKREGWRIASSRLGNKIRLSYMTYAVPRDFTLSSGYEKLGGAIGTDILASFVLYFDVPRKRLILGIPGSLGVQYPPR